MPYGVVMVYEYNADIVMGEFVTACLIALFGLFLIGRCYANIARGR